MGCICSDAWCRWTAETAPHTFLLGPCYLGLLSAENWLREGAHCLLTCLCALGTPFHLSGRGCSVVPPSLTFLPDMANRHAMYGGGIWTVVPEQLVVPAAGPSPYSSLALQATRACAQICWVVLVLKVGFTPRLIWQVPPNWLFINPSATKNRLQEEIKLKNSQLGGTYAGDHAKTPVWGGQITPSYFGPKRDTGGVYRGGGGYWGSAGAEGRPPQLAHAERYPLQFVMEVGPAIMLLDKLE
eukprot:881691-Pelagomonas_calceolata.AAC.5